ncbi:tonB dependent receptor family protein [Paraburkholderia xenovorans LB400]|uniref:TonB-dependent siderophore receptor n=1 Tax=Paraburkholderia xenovorans (strain LB400) TaxID=266265 RepID=Q13LJ4_PARXL|nr:TonB-dependent receptor [Paraburkholderia xenovorans]ABE35045.1 TonB-dependent siderophore receptor [Paraburkholderia xenovorans LB400]AIP35952.1 tonB dependent receptor family protein [Paraburkholderia xenovorans LB400]
MFNFVLRRLSLRARRGMRGLSFQALPPSLFPACLPAIVPAFVPAFVASPAHAQSASAEATLPVVSVSASANSVAAPRAVDPNLPASVETVTPEQFGNWNVVNTEDVLKYMPNLAVRKRFIGDLNSIIAVRGTSNTQSARGLVYTDGLLLSNLLGNSYSFPPRWSMVFPDEIQQVDVIYGPFSALYPGNSLGATVLISTRMPKQFEATADVKGFTQHFSLFGVNQNFNGSEASATIGDRIGKFSYLLGVNHLENTSQPLQFATLAQSHTPAKAGDIPVTGAYFYNNQTNTPTAVLGVNGEGIEHTVQDQFKLKTQYDFTPTLQGGFTLGYWHQTYNSQTSSFLRDANGNPVYSGKVAIDGYEYTIPAAALAPSLGHSENWLYGVSLKTRNATGWNGEAIASYYDVSDSVARTANSGAPGNGPGTVIFGDGTGWKTLDLRSTYTPATNQAGLTNHALSFGYHYDNYFLDNESYNTLNWRDGAATSFANAFAGKTQTQALYAQDAWRFLPRWKLVYGVRYEDWRAYGGSQSLGSTTLPYSDVSQQHFSPKASLSFDVTDDLTLRASIGRAYRFPTVSELFQGQINGSSIVNNNPNLKPEDDLSKELTAEWAHWNGVFRFSLFQDDVKNTIFSQTDTTVIPNVTNFQNIGKVRSRGVETSYSGEDVVVHGLDLLASVAYTQSKILENAQNPATVGKYFYRIPLWRADIAATYHFGERAAFTLAARYSGRQYNTLTNTDTNPDVFGGTSSYTVADAKFTFRPNRMSEVGIGVDNLFDARYFVYHPYPGRTFYVEAKLRM